MVNKKLQERMRSSDRRANRLGGFTACDPIEEPTGEARGHSISMSATAERSDLSQNGNGQAAEYLYFARGNDLGAPCVATSANGDPIDSKKISLTRYFH